MNELIRINSDSERPTVSGRELHDALGIETPYHKWFPRMCEYGFSEGKDYWTKMSNRSDGLAGKPRTDHQITVSMAKELCMIQRTEKGKLFRQYFISVEEQWNSPEAVMARALKISNQKLLSLENTVKQLEEKIEKDKPKTVFADAVSVSSTSILVGELAKLLKQNGVDMGQNRLFEWLRVHGYLISRKGTDYNMPTQKSMEKGFFEIKETCIPRPDGSSKINKTPKVTGKGQIYFINIFCGKRKNEDKGGAENGGNSSGNINYGAF